MLETIRADPNGRGGKAHVFVNEQTARTLPQAFEVDRLGSLGSQHIIVSPEFWEYVDEALGSRIHSERQVQIDDVRFDGMLEKKIYGQQSDPGLRELPELLQAFRDDGIYVNVELLKVGSSCPSLLERRTQTTGEQPRSLLNAVRTWQAKRKRFSLLGQLQDLKVRGVASTQDRAHERQHEDDTIDMDDGGSRGAGCGREDHEHGLGDGRLSHNQHVVIDEFGGFRHLLNWSNWSAALVERFAEEGCLVDACAYDDRGSEDFSISVNVDWNPSLGMVSEIFDRAAATYGNTPFPRNECQFKEHVKLRMFRFESDVVGKILSDCPLEMSLLGPDKIVVAKIAFEHMESIVQVCCSSDVLEYVLKGGSMAQPIENSTSNRSAIGFQRAFDVVVPRVAAAMRDSALGRFERSRKTIYRKFESQMKDLAEGPHEVADRLRHVVKELFRKFFCQEDIGEIAASKWVEQRDEHKQQKKSQIASRVRSQSLPTKPFRGEAWFDCPSEYRYASREYLWLKGQKPPKGCRV